MRRSKANRLTTVNAGVGAMGLGVKSSRSVRSGQMVHVPWQSMYSATSTRLTALPSHWPEA